MSGFVKIAFAAIILSACAPTANKNINAPRAVVDQFFEALASEDKDAALSLLTEDALLHAPYNPNGNASDDSIRSFPAALYVQQAMQTYDNLVFMDRAYSIADNDQTVWIEAEGQLKVAATQKPYENRYVFKISLEGDKISEITEYTNVATLARDGVTARTR